MLQREVACGDLYASSFMNAVNNIVFNIKCMVIQVPFV